MKPAKAIRVINAMIDMKTGALAGIDRYRWSKDQKTFARKVVQEDIDALRLAKDALRIDNFVAERRAEYLKGERARASCDVKVIR